MKATLYVPQGSLAAYKSAKEWRDFANIVEKYPSIFQYSFVGEVVAPFM